MARQGSAQFLSQALVASATADLFLNEPIARIDVDSVVSIRGDNTGAAGTVLHSLASDTRTIQRVPERHLCPLLRIRISLELCLLMVRYPSARSASLQSPSPAFKRAIARFRAGPLAVLNFLRFFTCSVPLTTTPGGFVEQGPPRRTYVD